MDCSPTPLDGLLILTPRVFPDERGYFFEAFRDDVLRKSGILRPFVQDNQSQSALGVLRGLHYQTGIHAQSKLIRVLRGEILDVVVDLREGSPTWGKSYQLILSEMNHQQLYIPRGFAHGFLTLSPVADILYKCDTYYCKEAEAGIRFDDSRLAIDWSLPADQLQLSEKDRQLPTLGQHVPPGISYSP